jgi:RND superfamily putative drug exporter
VASVTPAFPDDFEQPSAALVRVIPTTSPQSIETEELVQRLRDEVIPRAAAEGLDVSVTGFVPVAIDFSDYLGGRSLLFFGVVLLLSFVLLMVVFRSLLVPLKAVIMNMLSIAGAYGVVVAIFQWGHLGSITGVEPAPIEPFIPMMMFAIVFGLSMDYEVFLLSRVKEEYERTGDAKNSVADGLASTARVISAAAAIMVVVFGSFLLEDGRIVKVFGTGLSVAILLDATLVRMLLVPATMELLGARNWWIPRWLDRVLPHLAVEGAPDHEAQLAAHADPPEPDRSRAADEEPSLVGGGQ